MKKANGPGKAISGRNAVGEQELAELAAKKRLMEMNLLDDFLFGSVVAYPEIGEKFVRIPS